MKHYNIQINEAQRLILVAALNDSSKTDNHTTKESELLVDLMTLPTDQATIGQDKIVAFCE